MKNILVPTDFSPEAELGYSTAAHLAKLFGVPVTLLHVKPSAISQIYTDWNGYVDVAVSDAELEATQYNAEDKFALVSSLPAFEGVEVNTKVIDNKGEYLPDVLIAELNNETNAFIVMGTAAGEDDRESMAEFVSRNTVVPVITVRKPGEFSEKKVLLCTDFENITRGYFMRTADIAKKMDAELHVLFINTPKNYKSQLEAEHEGAVLRKRLQLPKFELHVFSARTPLEGVLEFMKRNPVDLVAMATHGRTGLPHMVMGSVSEEVVKSSDVPVAIFNLHEFNERHRQGMRRFSQGMTAGFGA